MTEQPYVPSPPRDPAVRRFRRLALAGMLALVVTLGLGWGSLALTYYTPGYSWTDAMGNVWYVPGSMVTGGEVTYKGYQTSGRVWVISAVLLTIVGWVRQRRRWLLVAAAMPILGLLSSKPQVATILFALVGSGLLVVAGLRQGLGPVTQQPGQH
ncbi:MAG: hypothetical protein ACOH16_14475 [Propionibacteriaceae bacterium]